MRTKLAARAARLLTAPLRRGLELLEDRLTPALTLGISPAALWEFSGYRAATGTVTRDGDLSQSLTVYLSSSDTTEATVPTSTVIPAGAASATFPVNAVDDSVVDGTQTATITASATVGGSTQTGTISYDTNWGTSGWAGNGTPLTAVAVQPDGKLVVAGYASSQTSYDFYVARYNANGTVDNTFAGTYGSTTTDVSGQKDVPEAVLVQTDGKIVVAGTVGNGPYFDWGLVRYNADGTLDATFGTGGKVVIDQAGDYNELWDIAQDASGKIVVSGNRDIGTGVTAFAVARLNTNGTLDSTFGTGGVAATTFGGNLSSRAFGVAIQPDGKIVAAGVYGGGNSVSTYAVARYNADGTPDATFGTNGAAVQYTINGYYDTGYDVAIQNGKIVVAGMTGRLSGSAVVYDVGLIRLNADGSLDSTTFGGGVSYGPTGKAVGTAGGFYAPVRMALQSDNRIVVVGTTGTSQSSSYGKIFRFSPDGVLENSTNSAWSTSSSQAVAVDGTGGIYLAYKYGSTTVSGYVDRYKSSGTGTPVSATATVTVYDNDPFSAAADAYAVDANTTLAVAAPGVLANDTVSTPNAPRAVLVNAVGSGYQGPSHGTVTLNADGSFAYTPTAGYSGTDTFYYQIVDGGAKSNVAAVTVTVRRATNSLPVAADDSYTTNEDTPLTGVLAPEAAAGNSLYMVSDPGDYIGQGKTWSYGSSASYGMTASAGTVSIGVSSGSEYWTINLSTPGGVRFVAGTTYTGATRFGSATQPGMDIYGNGRGSNTVTGQFTVLQVEYDGAGKITRFSASFEQHSEGNTAALRGTIRYNFLPSPYGVLKNDSDADGDPLTAALVTGPAHGTLAFNADGTFKYTPAADWNGTDSFTYTASDGYGGTSNVATATITVAAVNDPPTVVNDSYTTDEDVKLVVPAATGVLANDTDVDSATLTASVGALPSKGTLAFGTDGSFTYTPYRDANGTDTFTYRVSDGTATGNIATVTITINPVYDPPITAADTYTVTPGAAYTTTASTGVLANDRSPDGLKLTAVLDSGPTIGSLAFNADGSFTYTRPAGATGADSFTYRATDGTTTTDPVKVRLNVAPVGVADGYSTAEDTPLVVSAPGVLANDSDPDGDSFGAYLYASPAHGSLAWSGSGGFTYTPAANYNGPDSFSYRPYDGVAFGPVTTVSLTVTPVNDAPVAANDAYATRGDQTLVVNPAAAPATSLHMTSDSGDYIGQGRTYDFSPSTGTFSVSGNANYLTVYYSGGSEWWDLTFAGVGSNPLTPGTYTGAERAAFRSAGHPGLDVSGDGRGSNTLTGSFTVYQIVTDGSGKVVRFWADFVQHSEGSTPALRGTIKYAATGTGPLSVLDNDTDVDGDALTAAVVTGPSHGYLGFNPDGSFQYTAADPYYSGTDSFTYQASDGVATSAPATVTITVTPANRAPVGAADSYTTNEDTPLQVAAPGVLANDTDPDGDPLTARLVTRPQHGSFFLDSPGWFNYTPAKDWNGTDSFVYQPFDGKLYGDPVTVTITVVAVNDPPVASNPTFTTRKDSSLTVAAAAVGTDVEGDPLSFGIVTGPNNGSVTVVSPGYTLTYTPNAGFLGTDSFVYRLWDGQAWSQTASFTVNVVLNQPPVGVDDAGFSTPEDTVLHIAPSALLANDTDPEGDPLSVVEGSIGLATNGTVGFVASTNGVVTDIVFTPAPDFNGTATFLYKPFDGRDYAANWATVSITVTPVNDPPAAKDDSYPTPQDTTLTVPAAGVLANDADVDGDPLTAILVAGPTHGSLTLNADGSFTYTPAAGYTGADSFTYTANDGATAGNVATVSLTVTAVNHPPAAAADAYATDEDTTLAVATPGVLANDADPDGNPLTAVLVAGPTHGTLSLSADGSFTYTPAANYNGADSFTYQASDGSLDGNTVTVALTVNPVNDAPVATGEGFAFNEDATLIYHPPGVLGNDTDVDGDALTAVLAAGPQHGSLTLNADGSFSYTPAKDYNGPDSFTYQASDGTATSNVATVSLTVNPVNDAPAAAADAYATDEDTALVVAAPGVLANDTDVDSPSLTAALVTGPAHGTLALNADGSFTYTPGANYNGPDSFTYRPNDGQLDGGIATVSLTVRPVNDPPAAANDSYAATEDTPLTIASPGVLANDSDADGDPLTAVLVAGPAHGTLALNADGSFTYTPAANYNGADSFTYQAADGHGGTSNVATVALTVAAVDDAPAAAADAYATDEDTALVVAAPGVLANDTDVDSPSLTAALVSGPSAGSLVLNPDGSFQYTPGANFNGTDSFVYKPNDGTADGSPVVVTITVRPVNDAPVAADDSYSTSEDTVLTVAAKGVLANDSDVDGDPLTAALVAGPQHGTLTLNADGSFTYTPAANYHGADSFTYTATDGTAASNTATVAIAVASVNDAPVATADAYTVSKNRSFAAAAAAGVLANDTDADGDALTATLVVGPASGTLALHADGSFTYTPAQNYTGTASFTYAATDGQATSATVTVTLTVANDPPVAADDALTTYQNTSLTFTPADLVANDTDPNGDPLWANVIGNPDVGTMVQTQQNFQVVSLTYTPPTDFVGTATFQYRPTDGTDDIGSLGTVTITVLPRTNQPPAAAVTGPGTAVPGQEVAVTVSAADPDPADAAAAFVYRINWGDGTPVQTVTGPASGVPPVARVYAATGTYAVSVTATDPHGATGPAASVTVNVVAAALIDGSLYVGGTAGTDTITVRPANSSGDLTVVRNNTTFGPFAPTADVVVYGLGGDDRLTVGTQKIGRNTYSVGVPVYLFGGDGNDTLDASGAASGAVLSGGNGNDTLTGGSSDDVMIGGGGADTLNGGSASDILIGGIFDYESDLAVLRSVGAEWWGAANLGTRVNHLSGAAGGLNTVFLDGSTILDDGVADQLTGYGGTDWFFSPSGIADVLHDYKKNEYRTDL